MYCPNNKCPDFEATGKHGEYVAGISTCPTCGEYLVDTLPPDDAMTWEQSHYTEVEPVFETSDVSEVLVVKGLLESEGIPFVTSGSENFDAFRGWISPKPYSQGARTTYFMVPSPLAETVRELLKGLDEED